MKNSVLKKQIEYKGCMIYVRNNGEIWEYFAIINGELYTAFIIARKKPLQRILGKPYTAKQVSDITQYMLAMAQTTIETVLSAK